MELRHLRYFIAVGELLHFSRAARRLRVTQPSLSQQIHQLETELQTRLLERTKRHVELTKAGRLFLEEARQIVARADHAALIARRAGTPGAIGLRVGIGYCMDDVLVEKAICEFSRRHDSGRIEVKTMAVPQQLTELRESRLDVGLVRTVTVAEPLTSALLVQEALVVALPRTHRLATRPRIALAALAGERFLLVPPDRIPIYHETVVSVCRDAGFIPDAAHEADHLRLILGMVSAGCGISLVPASARTSRVRGIVYRPLDAVNAVLKTAVAWHHDASSEVLEFVRITRELASSDRRRRTSVK